MPTSIPASFVFAPLAIAALTVAGCQSSANAPATACTGPGTICPFAGTGEPAFTGEGDEPLAASLYWPLDLQFAPDGRAYILDWQNHRVRRVDGDGKLRTVFGTDDIGDGPKPGGGDETTAPGVLATSINLNHPTDIQFSPDGATMILAAWHNHKIRKMDVASNLEEIVCGRGPGFAGDGSGDAGALLNQPKAVAMAPSGDLYILDARNLRVRRIDAATGVIATVAGVGTRGAGGDGGPPLAAQFAFQIDSDNPEPGGALALDADGRLYVADTENDRVRRIDFQRGVIETVAGDGTRGAGGDGGPAVMAQLSHPRDLELGPGGRLFIADTENHKIRVLDPATGLIDTVAGTGEVGSLGDGGDARAATFHRPFGIAFDAAGDLYVADTLNNVVRRIVQP